MKKSIPEIQEGEGNEKIHSHNSGKGIRGFHSWEWMGTGIPLTPDMGRLLSDLGPIKINAVYFSDLLLPSFFPFLERTRVVKFINYWGSPCNMIYGNLSTFLSNCGRKLSLPSNIIDWHLNFCIHVMNRKFFASRQYIYSNFSRSADVLSGWTFCQEDILSGPPCTFCQEVVLSGRP